MNESSVLVRGGDLVSSSGTSRTDLLIQDGLITDIGSDLPSNGARVVDATGCLVMPGVIDAHTHPVYADDLNRTALAGASGGVTTLMAFVGAFPSWGFPKLPVAGVVADFIARWDGSPACDFGLHVAFDSVDDVASEVPRLAAMGVSSYKFFLAYRKRGMMVDDRALLAGMAAIAESGGVVAVHAENGDGIDYLESPLWDEPNLPNQTFLDCHSHLLEAEAVLRVIALAEAAQVPLYIPHVAAGDAIAVVELARKTATVPVWVETCTHYLVLTNDEVIRRGALSKIAPPLRHTSDNEVLWKAVRDGAVQVIATDHAGRTLDMKAQGLNILQAPYGAEGIEHLLPVLYGLGVRGGQMSVERLVSLLSENPADIFGLSPSKGRLVPGADGDVVVLDPEGTTRCSVDSHVGASDYCLYEGLELPGAIRYTIRRGEVTFDASDRGIVGGGGRFIARETFRARDIPVVDGLRATLANP